MPRNAKANTPLTRAQRDSLPNAGFGRRLGAMIYDSLLVIALVMSLLLIAVALSNGAIDSAYSQPLTIVASYAFFAFFWLRNRQTLGMLAWQLEIQPNSVAGENGDPVIPPLTLTMITLRFVGACAGGCLSSVRCSKQSSCSGAGNGRWFPSGWLRWFRASARGRWWQHGC